MAIVWQISYSYFPSSSSRIYSLPCRYRRPSICVCGCLCVSKIVDVIEKRNFPQKNRCRKKDVICFSLHYKIEREREKNEIHSFEHQWFFFSFARTLLVSSFSSLNEECALCCCQRQTHRHKHTHTNEHALKNDKFESSFPVLCCFTQYNKS